MTSPHLFKVWATLALMQLHPCELRETSLKCKTLWSFTALNASERVWEMQNAKCEMQNWAWGTCKAELAAVLAYQFDVDSGWFEWQNLSAGIEILLLHLLYCRGKCQIGRSPPDRRYLRSFLRSRVRAGVKAPRKQIAPPVYRECQNPRWYDENLYIFICICEW